MSLLLSYFWDLKCTYVVRSTCVQTTDFEYENTIGPSFIMRFVLQWMNTFVMMIDNHDQLFIKFLKDTIHFWAY